MSFRQGGLKLLRLSGALLQGLDGKKNGLTGVIEDMKKHPQKIYGCC